MNNDFYENQGICRDVKFDPQLCFWILFAMFVLDGLLYLATVFPFSFFPQ